MTWIDAGSSYPSSTGVSANPYMITPDDDNDLTQFVRAIQCYHDGTIRVITQWSRDNDSSATTDLNVYQGQILYGQIVRVLATGTGRLGGGTITLLGYP